MTHSWQVPRLGIDQEPLRVGAIGCGSHATTAIWPELANAGFVLEAVCSRSVDHAKAAARRFGVAHAFCDAETMLNDRELDALVIVVPPDAFAPYIRLAVDSRLPAFVEKPGANSPAEAEELARLAKDASVDVVVGYQKRFAIAYRKAKEVMASNTFGEPTLASFKWAMGPFNQRFGLREWLFENPVHHFDLARFFLGEISDLNVQVREVEGEFALVAIGRSTSGALLSINANTTASWEQHNEAVEIFGRGHSVLVDNVDTCIYRPAEGPEQVWRPNYTVPAPTNSAGETLGYGAELAHFRAVVQGETPTESDLASAAATLKLAGQIAAIAQHR